MTASTSASSFVKRSGGQTAMQSVQKIAADLSDCITTADALPGEAFLSQALRELERYGADAVVDVDIVLVSRAVSPAFEALARFVCMPELCSQVATPGNGRRVYPCGNTDGTTLCLHVTCGPEPITRRVGAPRPPVLVWAALDAVAESDTLADALDAAAEDRPIVVLIAPHGSNMLQAAASRLRSTCWHVTEVATECLEGVTLLEIIAPALSRFDGVVRADAVAGALAAVANVFGIALNRTARAITAQRALGQHRLARIQNIGNKASVSDVLNDVRMTLQRCFGEFKRGVDERFDAAFNPHIGSEWSHLEEHLAGIDRLDEDLLTKTTLLHLPPALEAEWLQCLSERLARHLRADLVAMADMLHIASADVEQMITAEGHRHSEIPLQTLSGDRLVRLLHSNATVQRHYQGEVARAGAFEYLMIARRYQMVLFMFISAFGLSFLRSYREFMIPAAVMLLSFGGLRVIHSIGQQRAECSTRELEKARDHLRLETKRIVMEVQRGWAALIGEHLANQLVLAVEHIECAVRAAHARQSDAAALARQKFQRQLRSTDSIERRIGQAAKRGEAVAGAIVQVRREFRQIATAQLTTPGETG